MNQTLTFEYSGDIESFSIRQRREDIPNIPRCEVWLKLEPRKDQFGRGLGDISAMGYGSTIEEAYASAYLRLIAAHDIRLTDRNAIPPGAQPRGLGSDFDELSSLLGLL